MNSVFRIPPDAPDGVHYRILLNTTALDLLFIVNFLNTCLNGKIVCVCVSVFLQYYKSFGSLPGSHALSHTS